MTGKNTKFAIIGMGFIYPRHVQAIKSINGDIVLTCDKDQSKNPDFTDWLEMYHHSRFEEVTHVVICTPNYLHTAMAREALIRGKQVLCEKPVSIDGAEHLEGVNTVLQLRYHPLLQERPNPRTISITAKMYRDDSYWKGWKGNTTKSGGILYNLGIHYLDLSIFLLGSSWEVIMVEVQENKVCAEVLFGDAHADFHIEVVGKREDQGRFIIIDGEEVLLSNQDNLSYENLHQEVYRQFVSGNGIPIAEAKKSLQLAHDILSHNVPLP